MDVCTPAMKTKKVLLIQVHFRTSVRYIGSVVCGTTKLASLKGSNISLSLYKFNILLS